MRAGDPVARLLGITVEVDEPGYSSASMVVRDDMTNALGVCHGGMLFSLADTAMAYASNAHGEAALAIHADIDWLRPARAGQTITAAAREVAGPGRTKVFDVDLRADGELIAVFRGRTRTVGNSAATTLDRR